MHVLQKELDYFQAHLEEWLKVNPGKVALVKGELLVGVFDTSHAAIAEGLRRFGGESFLVRRISRTPPRASILTARLGGRSADPAPASGR